MRLRWYRILIFLVLLSGVPLLAAPKTHTIEAAPFVVVIEEDALLEAMESSPVMLRLETWSQLQVVEAAEHGTRVEKGRTILLLDTTKIDEAIQNLEAEQALADLDIQMKQQAIQHLETDIPLLLTQAEESASDANLQKELFDSTLRQRRIDQVNFQVKQYENWLSYQEEELRQLELMYTEDEITEETEEIVLKRQRDAVEEARFGVKNLQQIRDIIIEIMVPREARNLEREREKLAIASRQLAQSLPRQLEKQELDLERALRDRKKKQDNLAELRRDRARLTVSAPADGLLYHGFSDRGQWNTSVRSQLRLGGKVPQDTIIMTVVKTEKLSGIVQLPEEALRDVQKGTKGTLTPKAFPDVELPVTISWVNLAPISAGKFEVTFTLGKQHSSLTPGMQGKLRIIAYYQEQALAIPSSAIFRESTPEALPYVWIAAEKPEDATKRKVRLGRISSDSTEILHGLSAGEEILLKPPVEK